MEELQLVWGWQPALYLFLGGMGASAFAVVAFLFLRHGDQDKKVLNASMWVALISLCVGLLLLVAELITPLRGMMMWQSFSNTTSWMTVGAWLIFAAAVFFFVTAVLTSGFFEKRYQGRKAFEQDVPVQDVGSGAKLPTSAAALPRQWRLTKACAAIGLVLGLGVAVYTGILLMSAPGVPLWSTMLLPCLFTVSALDTGVALIEIVAACTRKREKGGASAHLFKANESFLHGSVIVLVIVEAIVLVAFMASMLSGNAADATGSVSFATAAVESAELIVTGPLAPFFWILVVGFGLILPFSMAIAGIALKGRGAFASLLGALGALVGGCALRFVVLMAGLHVDYLLDAVAALPF